MDWFLYYNGLHHERVNMELNLSLISDKAPNLHSVIFSEMSTLSVANKRLL